MLDIRKAIESPLKEFAFKSSVHVDFADDAFGANKMDSVANLYMKFHSDYDEVVHINGYVDIPCEFVCDRCAGSFDKNFYFEFEEEICKKSGEEDDDGFAYDENGNIGIEEIVKNLIITNFPAKVLCNPDCKGLCQVCGVNLNDQECEHQNKKIGENNPFADLLNKLGGKNNGSSKT